MPIHLAKFSVQRYLRDKRSRKRDRRVHRKWKIESMLRFSKAEFDAQFGKRSRIVAMVSSCTEADIPKHKGKVRFVLPPSFSMIDSPEPALDSLAYFARVIRADRLRSVYIDFSKIKRYDLGANGLLDVLVHELSIEARRTGRSIRWQGNFPSDPAHVRFVRAMGVIRRLKVIQEYPSSDVGDRLTLFGNRCRHYMRAIRPREGP